MLALVAAGAALAGFVQGLSGFAFSLVALGVWAWALPPQVAAPLAVFGALLGQCVSFATLRKGYDFARIAPLVLGGLCGVPIGVFILRNTDPLRFKLAIGVLLCLYGLYGLLTSAPRTIRWGGRGADAFAGLIGGVLGGLGGMSGTAPAVWTQLRGWTRDLRRATMQVYNTSMHIMTLTVYARVGTLDAATLRLFMLAAPAMLIPAFLGTRLYGRFSEKTFTRVVFALLLASGAGLLVDVSRELFAPAPVAASR
jgi:uncharacterized membrane protein YfcA